MTAIPIVSENMLNQLASKELSKTKEGFLNVGGVVPFTSIDYPGELSTVIFVQGCPWRCGYCHNPHLQQRTTDNNSAWQDTLVLLNKRIGLIDAVVFSGGEPTIDPHLEEAIKEVKAMGFKIALHTGGIYPRRFNAVLKYLDWVGFDMKHLEAKYDFVTQVKNSAHPAFESLATLISSGVAFECRTTIHPNLHTIDDLLQLAKQLANLGVKNYALQLFRKEGCDQQKLNEHSIEKEWLTAIESSPMASYFKHFEFRKG